MNSGAQRTQRIEWTIFLVPFISYAYFYQAADQSTAARFDLMRSILERGSLAINDLAGYNTADIINFGGHIYSVKAPGTSLVAMLPWGLMRLWLLPLLNNHAGLYWALVTYLTIVLTIGMLISVLCVVMYRFARFVGASEGRAAALAIVLGLGTIAFPYATEMTGEPFAAAFGFIAFYLIATFQEDARWPRAFWAGLLAGVAVLNDYPALLIAAAVGFYALYRLPRIGDIAAFSAGAAIAAAVMLGYNWGAFGSPLFFSYQAFKLPGNTQFPEQAKGFVGLTYPKLSNLWNILIGSQRGLFFCNPVLILSLAGIGYSWRRREFRAEWIVTMVAIAGMILFNASYGESIVSWGGGTATGPRQIVAAVPFMILTLAFLPRSCDWLIGALGAVSVFMMLMATATNPHFPYEYANPVRDFAMQQYLRGDFATNRDAYFGGGMIAGDSTAFNLGKLAGLPRPLQLWPLGILWIAGALELTEALGALRSGMRARLGRGAIAIGIAAMYLAALDGWVRGPFDLRADHGLLGRYFVGEEPGITAPHLTRIDPRIDFHSVTELGAMPFPSVALWTGRIIAPRTGLYLFRIEADDAGWLLIDGRPVIRDPGQVNRPQAAGRVFLRTGPHRIQVAERNLAGDAAIELYWQPPGAQMDIVPSAALIPDRP
ncbi:MAG TPA: PA14 domain-containing protein [Candidatus Binataceae bacterium]|nr:PA14 domain-containing protein [Candidatus Binataceae bacterium]